MAVLGKRKSSSPGTQDIDASEIFRRHFEAQFKPLGGSAAETEPQDDSESGIEVDNSSDAEQSDEWGGVSASENDEYSEDGAHEDDATHTVEVVDHSAPQMPKPTNMTKKELKAFMSSRPPEQTQSQISSTEQPQTSKKSKVLPEDAPSLLAQDLELRRLISESHLLAPKQNTSISISSTHGNSAPEPKTFAAGRTRQRATDLRMQALGSKMSILKQEKMPMSMRKGMAAAAASREAKRRREAKENGVILERETGSKKHRRDRDRDSGVHRPGVGRLKGAELKISERDVKSIEGTKDTFGRRRKRR